MPEFSIQSLAPWVNLFLGCKAHGMHFTTSNLAYKLYIFIRENIKNCWLINICCFPLSKNAISANTPWVHLKFRIKNKNMRLPTSYLNNWQCELMEPYCSRLTNNFLFILIFWATTWNLAINRLNFVIWMIFILNGINDLIEMRKILIEFSKKEQLDLILLIIKTKVFKLL